MCHKEGGAAVPGAGPEPTGGWAGPRIHVQKSFGKIHSKDPGPKKMEWGPKNMLPVSKRLPRFPNSMVDRITPALAEGLLA